MQGRKVIGVEALSGALLRDLVQVTIIGFYHT